MPSIVRFFAACMLCLAVAVAAVPEAPYDVTFWVKPTPGETAQKMVVEVHPEWAPLGAARFRELVDVGFFDNCRFFRSIKRFVAQFGLAADPEVTSQWRSKRIADDPAVHTNVPGTLTFATSGPNSRTTQLFFNFGSNTNLDKQGFAPFAVVKEEYLDVLKRINTQYGDSPNQGKITKEGEVYLAREFKKLSVITSVTLSETVVPEKRAFVNPAQKEGKLHAEKLHKLERIGKSPGNKNRGILPSKEGNPGEHGVGRNAALQNRNKMLADGAHVDDEDKGFCASPHCPLFVVLGLAVLGMLFKTQKNPFKGE